MYLYMYIYVYMYIYIYIYILKIHIYIGDNGNLIALQGQAIDIFLSSSLITTNVAVNRNPDMNLTQILNTNVASGFSTGDINLVFQTINNVSLKHNCIYMYIYIDKYI
jgi:hypothetical protein